MKREDLVKSIYYGNYCPNYNCTSTTKDMCKECSSKALTKYENEIYNKALEDVLQVVEWDGYTLVIKERIEHLKKEV